MTISPNPFLIKLFPGIEFSKIHNIDAKIEGHNLDFDIEI